MLASDSLWCLYLTIMAPSKFVPNVAGHISVYFKWQAFESKIMWKIVFSWTVIFLSASSSYSKSKLIHCYIQQWCHSNKMPKRLDQSFGYMLKSWPHSSVLDVTCIVNILCFQVWNYLFVENFLCYVFITIDDIRIYNSSQILPQENWTNIKICADYIWLT